MLLYFVIDMCDNLKLQMQKYNIVIKKQQDTQQFDKKNKYSGRTMKCYIVL